VTEHERDAYAFYGFLLQALVVILLAAIWLKL
jgi:hypothetical protein